MGEMIPALVEVEKNTRSVVDRNYLEEEIMSENRNEFWAFAAGLLAGGIAALLYAPAKGEVTRRKIKETAEETYHKGEEYYDKGKTEVEKIYHDGREKAEKIYTDSRAKVDETIDYVKEKVSHKEEVVIEPEVKA